MEKFDVFISFKNTDSNGERTQDAVMAEELYYALKEKGINAFYSSISIPESGEYDFGDMIDAAIEQCSILVVVGTSIENFNSKWVSHEFKTFRQEMLSGNKASERSAMFSYITKNVNTNKLPMALRYCQAFTSLSEVVNSVCARFKQEKEIVQNFTPIKTRAESIGNGTLIDNKYKILQEIGRGGMSIVYLAMDVRIQKTWAIKVLRKDGVHNYNTVKQDLLLEVNMLKRMNHPTLPSIVDVIDNEDSFIIVMDYIEGKPLNHVLEESGPQPQEMVVEWAKELCDVLEYLHTRKPAIIYRDMKPANVMLRPDGSIKLIDFGTAREYKEKNLADTTCLGTVGYAAPEQFGGMGQTDARTDIYCLGVTLYTLLTNKNPSKPPYEIQPICQVDPKLSKGLEYIILKATSRDPELRYQSVKEMLYDIEHLDAVEKKAKKADRLRKFRNLLLSEKETVKPKKASATNNGAVVPKFEVPGKQSVLPVQPVPRPIVPTPVSVHQPYAVPGQNKPPVPIQPGAASANTTPLRPIPVPTGWRDNEITDVLATCSVFVTSKPSIAKAEEVAIRFYLVTYETKEAVQKAIMEDGEYSNLVTGGTLRLRVPCELQVELDSQALFLNRHSICLSAKKPMESVAALVRPSEKAGEKVALCISVKHNGTGVDRFILECDVANKG